LVLPPAKLTTPLAAKALDPEFVNAPTILAMPDRGAADEVASGPVRRDPLLVLDLANRYLGGRRRAVLTTLSLICGAGPALDAISGSQRAWFSIVSANLLLFGVWLSVFTWLTSLRDDDGSWKGRLVFTRLHVAWSAIWETTSELRELDLTQRFALAAAVLFNFGCLALAAGGLMSLAEAIVDPGSGRTATLQLSWWLAVGAIAAALPLWFWARIVRAPKKAVERSSGKLEVRADTLPAFVDLQAASLPPLRQELILRVFLTLSKWSQRRRRRYDSTSAYRAALARHFRQHANDLGLQREVWLGKTRAQGVAELIIARSLIVTVRKGFAPPTAEGALLQQLRLQQSCPSKRKLLLVFDTEPRALQQNPATSALARLHAQAGTTTLRVT